RFGDRAAERGPARRSGNAGVGPVADPEEAAGEGRARHGAHLGCADERDELRRVRAARRAGVIRRRTPGAGARWRSDRARCPETSPGAESERRRARAPARGVEETRTALRARLRRALSAPYHASRRGLPLRFPRAHRPDPGTGPPLT